MNTQQRPVDCTATVNRAIGGWLRWRCSSQHQETTWHHTKQDAILDALNRVGGEENATIWTKADGEVLITTTNQPNK